MLLIFLDIQDLVDLSLLAEICKMFRAKTKRTAKVVFHEVFLDGQQIGSTAIPRLHGKAMRPLSFSKCIFDL